MANFGEDMLRGRLSSTAANLALHRQPRPSFEAAVAELMDIAGGRTDLLAQAAGLMLGANPPSREDWYQHLLQARMLIAAGADQGLLPEWVRIGRLRANISMREEPLPDLAEICASVTVASPPAGSPGWDDRY